MTDNGHRETTVVTTSGGNGGWIFAIVLVLLLAVGGWYVLAGPGASQIDIDVNAPAATDAPASGAADTETPAADSGKN